MIPRLTALALGLALAAPAAGDPPARLYLDGPDPGPAGNWHADVVVGLPVAGRLQWRVPDTPLWLEGGAGLFVIIPTAFAGARAEAGWTVNEAHALAVRPGLDLYYFAPSTFGQLGSSAAALAGAVDVDLVWRARWRPGLFGEFGLKFGLLIAGSPVRPLPIGGLIAGLRF